MTERLYYKNSSLLEFEAEIVESKEHENGFAAILDRSAFYPTSGGQMHDLGKLNDIDIIDVIEDNDLVLHISKQAVGKVGNKVNGIVDANRRLRHRQQHTAQHILSQAFHHLFNLRTESVHLGEEYGAVELNTESLTEDQLQQAEEYSNNIIVDNLPVDIQFIDSEEIEKLPMRKFPTRTGKLRIIKIGKIEYSACGGTHVDSTAQVQMVKIIGTEKLRKRALVKLLSGVQIINDYALRYDVTSGLTKKMTCSLDEIAPRFEKLEVDNKSMRRKINQLRQEQLPNTAKELAENCQTVGEHKVVFHDLGSFDNKLAGMLGSMTAEKCGGIVTLLFDGRVSISTSPESCLDAGLTARNISEKTGLKGGGSKNSAQLGGEIDKAELEKLIIEIISNA